MQQPRPRCVEFLIGIWAAWVQGGFADKWDKERWADLEESTPISITCLQWPSAHAVQAFGTAQNIEDPHNNSYVQVWWAEDERD